MRLGAVADGCGDDAAALRLKMAAVASILLAGVAGVALPLIGRKRRLLGADTGLFALGKAFAAGVILATGFVHMLHDAQAALADPSLPEWPWRRFPVSGFVAMTAALWTLVSEFVGTQFYEWKQRKEEAAAADGGRPQDPLLVAADGDVEEGEVSSHVRHAVTSQILELGIVSHSVIIGLSLGVSQSPCTIRPLVAALTFHQFFEGFALGGCISQAQFKNLSKILMACFFSVTTPTGICVGASIASFYNANTPRAHLIEGILDSVSAGILIYMALVDLIAADFLHRRLSSNFRLQVASFAALFLGAASMSTLAIWA